MKCCCAGDLSAADLAAIIRSVKTRVRVPVTYADVWEFWLRSPDVAAAARLHHHPYPALLGGFPDCRRQFGEPCRPDPAAGWWRPSAARKSLSARSAGRAPGGCARGALPSPANQARVIQDVLALAQGATIARVNVIEGARPALETGAGKAPSAAIGAFSTPPTGRNSSGAKPSPIIRTGSCRRRAALPSPRWFSARPGRRGATVTCR